jgi:hypothetical protein
MEEGTLVEITDPLPFKAQGFQKIPKVGVFNGFKYGGYGYVQGLDAPGAVAEVYGLVDKAKLPFKALTGNMRLEAKKMQENFKREHIGLAAMKGPTVTSTGTDPEIFVTDAEGELIPAYDFLPKKTVLQGNVTAFWDGFQAEFATRATGCLAYEVDYIREGLLAVLNAARVKVPKAKLSMKSVFEIPPKLLRTANEEHVLLGCAPSENVYGNAGIQVDDGRKLPWRCAGGHIHLAIGLTPKQKAEAVRALDYLLGVASVSLFRDFDSPMRRELYGLAGEYRTPKAYAGIEYRTLPNTWLCHPAICHLIFDFARSACRVGAAGLLDQVEGTDKQVQEIINGCDVKGAVALLKKNKRVYESLFEQTYQIWGTKADCVKHGFLAFTEGLAQVVKDPEDIAGNWMFNGGWTGHSEAGNCQWNKAVKTLSNGKTI